MTASVSKKTPGLSVRAYIGDAKTLLAFDMPQDKAKNLVGFTIKVEPEGQTPFYLHNTLTFASPPDHAQDPKQPPGSSLNAPFQKFRWLHVPGSIHQGLQPFMGMYTYTVTPRYVDDKQSMLPLDPKLSVAVKVPVQPFELDGLKLGFTRGYVQSQGFLNHFGPKALIRPNDKELQFDTSEISGANAAGQQYSFEEEYEWLGFTARSRIMDLLDEVLADGKLTLDVFAYDLNEPTVIESLLALAKVGRVRVILDDAALHHDKGMTKPEDQFETLFTKAMKNGSAIKRGHFKRFAHDKVFVVRKVAGGAATQVLCGSTNFSVTGMYVNSNHVLVFDDASVAGEYAKVFDAVWDDDVSGPAFVKSELSTQTFDFKLSPRIAGDISFAPHSPQMATSVLDAIAARIAQEGQKGRGKASVLFAVMEMDNGTSPVYTSLSKLHGDQKIFSYGISDNPSGIALYEPGKATGVLVTGKPSSTILPPPFNQVRSVGLGHQIHHKFVVCAFNDDNPTVYCGSSNLALGGEQSNGDNLICLHGEEVATVFALEAIALVDHFQFLDRYAAKKGQKEPLKSAAPAAKDFAAKTVKWSLRTTGDWARPYFDSSDLKFVDRQLFA
ncbi:phospholipase D-like domain-containing protein [Variovorax ureilyticus]|uniref:phospholipase D n=1 Tax=Variovorax ureilyticus TaxID=1836198 RepID=A0ABU8VQ35_9BURK